MPQTVDDFMARFGGKETVDDREAAQYHERFVSTHPDDQHFDNQTYHAAATEYLGKLPDDEFHQATRTAVAQAPAHDRQGLLGTLMGALGGPGGGAASAGGLGGIAKMLGLSSSDPSSMSEDDAARVVDYTRKQRPEVLQKAVEEKPWFLKALGNPVVMGALTMAAAKMVSNQRNKSR